MKELKKISELIEYLKQVQDKEGDIAVCVSQDNEYWGDTQDWLNEYNCAVKEHCQPDGPKSGKSVKALRFG